MTKKELIEAIEDDGRYYHVRIDTCGKVTGVPIGESPHHHTATNTGGRRFLGYDSEIAADLIQ